MNTIQGGYIKIDDIKENAKRLPKKPSVVAKRKASAAADALLRSQYTHSQQVQLKQRMTKIRRMIMVAVKKKSTLDAPGQVGIICRSQVCVTLASRNQHQRHFSCAVANVLSTLVIANVPKNGERELKCEQSNVL